MDAIALVEAAYRMDDTMDVWLNGIVQHATKVFQADGGSGCAGMVIDATLTTDTSAHLKARRLEGPWEDAQAAFSEILSLGIQPATVERIRSAGPVSTLSAALGDSFAGGSGMRECLHKYALGDAGHVVAGDPLRVSCILATSFSRPHTFQAERLHAWQLMGAHVAAGLRLRVQGSEAQPEAVLDLDGNLQHAVGDASVAEQRERLRSAVRDLVRARGSIRRTDPMEALSLWQALVAGRWSLIDRVDSDGRRFLVACRNEPHERAHRALTHRQAQVATLVGLGHANKVVAYELGVSMSAVSTHLRRAMSKLGVTSRSELVELFVRTVP